MMNKLLFGLTTTVVILAAIPLPALALRALDPDPQLGSHPEQQSEPSDRAPDITIPASTQIEVSFPSEIMMDVNHDPEHPLTLMLAKSIADAQGNVIIPENTPINVVITPLQGGAQIVAESIEFKGQTIPLQAASRIIPETRDNPNPARPADRRPSPRSGLGTLLDRATGLLGGRASPFGGLSLLGTVAGLVTDALRSSPTSNQITSNHLVQIPEGSVHTLTLQAPLRVPESDLPSHDRSANDRTTNSPSLNDSPPEQLPSDNPLTNSSPANNTSVESGSSGDR